MKTLSLLFWIISSLSAFATITERYVTSAGAGAADGTSEANAMSYATFIDYMAVGGSFTAAPGDRFNLKGSISRTTTSDTWVNGGTVTSPVIIRGYTTTIGDGYLGRTNGTQGLIPDNMAVLTTTTGGLTISGNFVIFEAIHFSGTRNGAGIIGSGGDIVYVNSIIDDNSTGTSAKALTCSGIRATVLNCDLALLAASGGSVALDLSTSSGRAIGCRITGGTGFGVSMANSTQLLKSLVYNSSIGVDQASTSFNYLISANTITGCSSNGIRCILGNLGNQAIINNIITDNGGYGIEGTAASNSVLVAFNRMRDNVMGDINLATDWVAATSYSQVTTDTGGPSQDFQNSGAANYTLVSTSPAIAKGVLFSAIGAFQITNSTVVAGSYTFSQ
jgi:hypothetical protein